MYPQDKQLIVVLHEKSGGRHQEFIIENGSPLKPNDRYTLDKDKFYLYYTPLSAEQQSIDIYIKDGWQVQKYTFEFSNKQVEEEEDAGVEQNL